MKRLLHSSICPIHQLTQPEALMKQTYKTTHLAWHVLNTVRYQRRTSVIRPSVHHARAKRARGSTMMSQEHNLTPHSKNKGGVEKNCAHGKNCVPPPPFRGCLRKKSCPAIIVAFGKFFTQGQILVQKWNSLHQISLCTLACTELFEPIHHFKIVLLVEAICEGAFFFASTDQCTYKD